jgi:hypothetical protein
VPIELVFLFGDLNQFAGCTISHEARPYCFTVRTTAETIHTVNWDDVMNAPKFAADQQKNQYSFRQARVSGRSQPSAGSGPFSFPKETVMTTSEVLNRLRAEGFENAKSHIIGHGIKAGAIPRPELNSSLQFVWGVRNVSAARRYLLNVPKPGRKKALA